MKISDITPENITNAVQGTTNLVASKLHIREIYLEEQFRYRAFLCLECVKHGKCLVCGCSSPGIFYAPNKHDPKNRWPLLLQDAESWAKFKERDDTFKKFQALLSTKGISYLSDNYFRDILSISNSEYNSVMEGSTGIQSIPKGGDQQIRPAA
jgi:hypothetical protein